MKLAIMRIVLTVWVIVLTMWVIFELWNECGNCDKWDNCVKLWKYGDFVWMCENLGI